MEQGEVPLAELLSKYEEGTRLLKVCETRLKDAELKIEKLKKQKDGSAAFESFEPARQE
ncbi:MAG: exodeoxyribonuclease VII small subunit [Opitutus sp.]|nr:exodeoxyribonuclease VII small subunit [Opitutus sp.]